MARGPGTPQGHRPCRDALAEAPKIKHCFVPVNPPRPSRMRALLGDPHFWIPVAVLVIGLLVLRWIA